jgi:hypothetical protein
MLVLAKSRYNFSLYELLMKDRMVWELGVIERRNGSAWVSMSTKGAKHNLEHHMSGLSRVSSQAGFVWK